MATSGSVDFNPTATVIVDDALRMLGVIDSFSSAEGEEFNIAMRTMTRMLKSWQAQGLHLWVRQELVLFITPGQQSYRFGGSSPDRMSLENIKTTISTAAVSGATSLVVGDTTGMAASDNIGIQLDDGTTQWTTIVSVDSSTELTITAALTDDVAISNAVFVYTTAYTQKPWDIHSVRVRRTSNLDTPLHPLSRDQYLRLQNKDLAQTPVQYYVDKQRDYVDLYLYGVGDSGADRLLVDTARLVEDMDSSADTLDLPAEWHEAVTYNLALRLAPNFDKEEKAALVIAPLAAQTLQAMKDHDLEMASFTFTPRI